jgi:hypothetical protein
MHQRWLGDEKQRFLLGLQQCDDIETLRNLMLIYARALRTPTFIKFFKFKINLNNNYFYLAFGGPAFPL